MKTKLFLAGHRGLVGSSILRHLTTDKQFHNFEILTRTRTELDLTRQEAVEDFFAEEKPDITVCASARVGGILANDLYSYDFIRDNLLIQTNLIESARKFNCKRFCFLGSSCVYPKFCPQPIKEEYLLSGPLEETNIGYSVAKIAGIQMINSYRQQYQLKGFFSIMPCNLYGPGDSFDLQNSHFLPALIRKFHEAKISESKEVVVWGQHNSTIRRELMYSNDLAESVASTLLLDSEVLPEIINVGSGIDNSIHEIALMVKKIVGYTGNIVYDTTKPSGTPQKLLDISRAKNLGLIATTGLEEGIRKTYKWYQKNKAN